MTEHLSGKQLARWMAGEQSAAEEEHAGECARCSAEITRMELALGRFRDTVRDWSESESEAAQLRIWVKAGTRRRGWASAWVRWPLVAAAVLVLSLAPVYKARRDQEREATLARADAQLLEQVDREISEAVPSPLEPLAQLVTWGSDSQSNSQTDSKQGETK